MSNDISVVIPTYNEKESICSIIALVLKEIPSVVEIIIVDDDSPDGTALLVQDMSRFDERIKLLSRKKRGLPSALKDGIELARSEAVLWVDADFSASAGTLKSLAEAIHNCDVVVASRYCAGGKDSRRERARVFFSRVINVLSRRILAVSTRDLTSGYVIARKKVFEKTSMRGYYGDYCIRFLFGAEKAGFKVKEVPYVCLSRVAGLSKTATNPFAFFKLGMLYLLTVLQIRITGK